MEQNSRTAARRLGATASHRETVEQAEAYLRAHLDAPMRVSSLSRMVGLSERSLRDAFYSVRGVSPKRWLLAERLDRARRALRAGGSTNLRAPGVATNFGFYELGRFAATYRAAFGEVPSVTLRDTIRRSAESQSRLKGINDVCARQRTQDHQPGRTAPVECAPGESSYRSRVEGRDPRFHAGTFANIPRAAADRMGIAGRPARTGPGRTGRADALDRPPAG